MVLGSVVLAVTGAEALYADMGHFGRKPIGISWLVFVLPALMLNYMGQGHALLDLGSRRRRDQGSIFPMIPDAVRIPVILLAMLATIIASQAVISGAFSLTQQAIQLGFMPRMQIEHTSPPLHHRIIPAINWFLLAAVLVAVVGFGSSSDSRRPTAWRSPRCWWTRYFFVIRYGWGYPLALSVAATGFLILVDAAFSRRRFLKPPKAAGFRSPSAPRSSRS